ncbi:hypothetical protein B0T25DRAFT_87676 [Lasiosphaeria hispida]|uniref:Secreted protein n=1 Tax=Lasiosphaeria hispida TaxID=260671 RepID=A0AAJ0HQ71_9PEZI|nr:hypothetical protein B0T25DRAFT_87676 [Lasiosphaeria hispida]
MFLPLLAVAVSASFGRCRFCWTELAPANRDCLGHQATLSQQAGQSGRKFTSSISHPKPQCQPRLTFDSPPPVTISFSLTLSTTTPNVDTPRENLHLSLSFRIAFPPLFSESIFLDAESFNLACYFFLNCRARQRTKQCDRRQGQGRQVRRPTSITTYNQISRSQSQPS